MKKRGSSVKLILEVLEYVQKRVKNYSEMARYYKKALLVTGASQTGKTWLIRDEIKKSSYRLFEINFIDQPDTPERLFI